MFEDAAWIILALIGISAFTAYRDGKIGDWLRAKFFNAAQPSLPLGDVPAAADAPTSTAPAGLFSRLATALLGRPLPGVPDPTDAGKLFGALRPGHTHAGVDWSVPTGTEVHASAGGRVTYAGAMGDYGLAVDVDHGNGLSTRYGHLSTLKVRVGDVVNAGQVLGLSGSTGRSTGPHLHFEVRQDNQPIDPLGALSSSSSTAGTSGGVWS